MTQLHWCLTLNNKEIFNLKLAARISNPQILKDLKLQYLYHPDTREKRWLWRRWSEAFKGEGDVEKWSLIGPYLCYFLICDWKKIVPRPLSYVFFPTELISGVKLGLGSCTVRQIRDFWFFSIFLGSFFQNFYLLMGYTERPGPPSNVKLPGESFFGIKSVISVL